MEYNNKAAAGPSKAPKTPAARRKASKPFDPKEGIVIPLAAGALAIKAGASDASGGRISALLARNAVSNPKTGGGVTNEDDWQVEPGTQG